MFADVQFLYLGIIALSFLVVLTVWSEKKKSKRLQLLTTKTLLAKLVPNYSKAKKNTKLCFLLLSFVFAFLALARPQWGKEQKISTPRGIDVLVAVDVSKSMLARDITPNRLERVKLGLSNLMGKVQGNRLGLIAFAGSAFLQCPLTLDHQAFLKTLEHLEVGVIKSHGTNLALPIDEAARSFAEVDKDRFLILISDGEDLEGEGLKRAKLAKTQGIKIFTIGIGSSTGAFIPTDPTNLPPRNFLKDRNGKPVLTKMDEQGLRKIAESADGRYFPLGSTGQGLVETFEILKNIGHERNNRQLSTELPIERFQPFVLLALLFLFLEVLTPNAKNLRKVGLLSIFPLLFGGCFKRDDVQRAEDATARGDPSEAARFYSLEINASSESNATIDPWLYLNAGLSYLEANSLVEAEKFLIQAVEKSEGDSDLQSVALNSLGNLYYRKTNEWLHQQNLTDANKSWQTALDHYENAFKIASNGNDKAEKNFKSLQKEIKKLERKYLRIISGRVWHDLNGNGTIEEDEPGLKASVFWDRDRDGELNSSKEQPTSTDDNGIFTFGWIGAEPTQVQIGSTLRDFNRSNQKTLIPSSDPPIANTSESRNINLPYREAPVLSGMVWADQNGNGEKDENEEAFSGGKIFFDLNKDKMLDENDTSFPIPKDGRFNLPIRPGSYSIGIAPENPDANVTYPHDDFHDINASWEDPPACDFGVFDRSEKESQQSSDQQKDDENSSQDHEENANSALPEMTNSVYEREQQNTESKSQPLPVEAQGGVSSNNGRDY